MIRASLAILWQRSKAWRAWGREWTPVLEDEPELRAFGDRAYTHCVEWFGQPADPQRPYVLVRGVDRSSRYAPRGRLYYIVASRHCKTQSQRLAAVAHEMFHRIS